MAGTRALSEQERLDRVTPFGRAYPEGLSRMSALPNGSGRPQWSKVSGTRLVGRWAFLLSPLVTHIYGTN